MTEGFATPEECFQYLFCVKRDLQWDYRLGRSDNGAATLWFWFWIKVAVSMLIISFPWIIFAASFAAQSRPVLLIAIGFSVAWLFMFPFALLLHRSRVSSLMKLPAALEYDEELDSFVSTRHGWAVTRNENIRLVGAIVSDRVSVGKSWKNYEYKFLYLVSEDRYFPIAATNRIPSTHGGDLVAIFCDEHGIKSESNIIDVTGLISDRDRIETLARYP